ncbi:MAG TPA: VanW family protein, partial [Fimbriimonas sp.]
VASLKEGKSTLDLPLTEAPKTVPDDQLAEIKEVVSSFSTNFPRNPNRNSNIRLAASKLDGIVLAPGDRLSFNETVGRRTVRAGFKEAGVFINGRHDTGVGGGICQVSTTLYNASLFGNLKIPKRTNHSLPVAYVPLGRDATVNWGAQDLVIENSYDTPIAVDSEYRPGRLTFRILGKKVPGLSVKIERSRIRTWSGGGTRTIFDPKLPPGTRKVLESGGVNRQVSTTRAVYLNGKLQKKEPLGRSTYMGGVTIVAVGPKAKPSPRPRVVDSDAESRSDESSAESPE